VRFLISIPQEGVEIGDTGRIKMIERRDDTSYFIELEADPRGCLVLRAHELWKIELVETACRS
jgi:hypothetical protein